MQGSELSELSAAALFENMIFHTRSQANVFDDEIRDAFVTAIEEDKEVELEEREESDKGNL